MTIINVNVNEALWATSILPEGMVERWFVDDGATTREGHSMAEIRIEAARHRGAGDPPPQHPHQGTARNRAPTIARNPRNSRSAMMSARNVADENALHPDDAWFMPALLGGVMLMFGSTYLLG